MTIPGIGPIAATVITAWVLVLEGFCAGRDFEAWLALTPLQKSTGGKRRLGAAISKMGERMIRRLLILGVERRGALGRSAWRDGGIMAGADALRASRARRHHRLGQQDGPHRLGLAGRRAARTELRPWRRKPAAATEA